MASWNSKIVQRKLRMNWDRKVRPDLDAFALRARHSRLVRRFVNPAENVETSPFRIGNLRVEWVEPAGSQFHRVLVYLHGGGYVTGGLDAYRNLASRLAAAASARALLVDYRLAPEHPFPAALEDALAAYRWLLLQGIDASGIALAGDGSGGGLALAAALALRDNKAPMPGAIVALSPWTDLALSGRSLIKNSRRDALLSLDLLAYCAQSYLKGAVPTSPLASPLYANLAGLPPTLIHAGANEVLRDDAVRFAAKADRAGVDISVEIFDGMPHVFQMFETIPETEGSVSRLGGFIKSRTASVPMHLAAQ